MSRVALYARYSDDKQSPHSIEDQFRICRMHADKQGWPVVETYSDAGISGSTVIFRPGFQALLRDALAGKFDVVVAEALDRLSRDQEDIAAAFKRLRFAGVPIITLSEGEISELHVGLKGTMNALFLKDLAAKTHRGIRGRVEAGKVGCGNAYGYKVIRTIDEAGRVSTGEREIIADEAQVIRRIFRDYAAGKSPRRIAIELNEEGVPAPWGGRWSDTSIRGNRALGSGIINNEFYVGEMIWNRRRRMKHPDTGRISLRFNPESEWVHVQAPHLQIVSDELWAAARAKQSSLVHVYEENMAKHRSALAAMRRPKTLLSGLIVCGVCGGSVAKRSGNRFGCSNHNLGNGCSNKRTIVRDVLEARVLKGLKERLVTPDAIAQAMRTFIEESNRLNHQRRATRGGDVVRLEKARKAIAGIVRAIEDGGYTRPLMERLKGLEAEAVALEAKLAEPVADLPDLHPNIAELYRRKVERLSEALSQPEERNEAAEALRAVIKEIILTPGPKPGQIHAELRSEFEILLQWAQDDGGQRRKAVGGFLGGPLSVTADSRASKTVLQNLRVTAQHDGKGKATGRFEVHVGGRRLRALNILADRKEIARAFLVPCVVCPDEATALEESIAENSVRLAPHPADQFAAFHALSLTGKTVSEIAERFSVAPRIVERRLKLATVSPRLMELFRANEVTLDHMAAFTLTDDHGEQEAAYFDVPEHDRQAYRVKQRLVGGRVNSQTNATAKFVGLDAYRAAGGAVSQDLFAQADDAGFITDLTLLERLASEALEAEAKALELEGWAWVETTLRFDYSLSQTYGRAYPTVAPVSVEGLAQIEQLTAEIRKLEEMDPQTDEAAERVSQIEDLIYDLESSGEEVYAPEVKAITGAIVTIGDDGCLRIERGCAKPGADTKVLRKLDGKATDGGASVARERTKKPVGALPDKLVLDLTAHRTAALRAALIERPDVAFVAVVHSLLLLTHYGAGHRSSPASTINLQADLSANHPRKHAEGFEASKAGEALKHVQGRMTLLLPLSHADLWPFLLARDTDQLLELVAYAASQMVDAVKQPFEKDNSARQVASDHLAKALDLDMAKWWAPTAQGYFGRVSKALIVAAVQEATTAQAAENIAGLKKQELAAEAERCLEGKGWLPAILRPREIVQDEEAVERAAYGDEDDDGLDEGAPWDEDEVPMAAE